MTAAAWEPGDALHEAPFRRNPLFNWRDSSEGPICNCNDAARWPVPNSWELGPVDDFERFIAECRAERMAS